MPALRAALSPPGAGAAHHARAVAPGHRGGGGVAAVADDEHLGAGAPRLGRDARRA